MFKYIKDNREGIQVALGIFLILFGCIISTLGFFVPVLGIIDSSVLWLSGQAFIAGGSLIGIAIPIYNKNKT